jgi:aldose 1-epimerase
LADQLTQGDYVGSTVGRVANRIRGASFVLDGALHHLSANDGVNCLHGGSDGFSSRIWSLKELSPAKVTLELRSPNGDMGFPGALHVLAEYAVRENDLRSRYTATTGAPTVVNLANHVYWNLSGGCTSIAEHHLRLHADAFVSVDGDLLPTGETPDVSGTPFDFRTGRTIGDPLDVVNEQLQNGHGYDHSFVLNSPSTRRLRLAAELRSPAGGFELEVHTTQPALHLYSGNHFDGSASGLCGGSYERLAGVALEAQGFPDAPNHPNFPSIVLRPGSVYRQTTVYRVRRVKLD